VFYKAALLTLQETAQQAMRDPRSVRAPLMTENSCSRRSPQQLSDLRGGGGRATRGGDPATRVEKVFKRRVTEVATCAPMPGGKWKRIGQVEGTARSWKKAMAPSPPPQYRARGGT